MNWAGPNFILNSVAAPLPPPRYGVGVYYNMRGTAAGSLPDWEPPGYSEGVVADPSGTILLAELPNGRNAAGNDWPSFCAGPGPGLPAGADADSVQVSGASRLNYGAAAYGLHGRRFNYLFHDGHAAVHTTRETVGTGTPNAPLGMWTMRSGD